jgi:hypothetical protein
MNPLMWTLIILLLIFLIIALGELLIKHRK